MIPPRQFCDQMSLSDNIIQKVLAFRAPLERYCPKDRFDTDCVLGTQFVSHLVLTEISPNPAISPELAGFLRVGFVSRSPRLELRRLIGPFVSGLKIPFPGNGDLGSKRLGSNGCFSDPEDEHFRSVLEGGNRPVILGPCGRVGITVAPARPAPRSPRPRNS